MQPFRCPAEMKLGGYRDERFQLPQFHTLTVPPYSGIPPDRRWRSRLFGRAEQCLRELPLVPVASAM